jgi:hypothetical protein
MLEPSNCTSREATTVKIGRNLLVLGAACAAAVFAAGVRGDAVDEVKRLAALMEWKPGTVAADIGAGDG